MRRFAAVVFAGFLGGCALFGWAAGGDRAPQAPPAPRSAWIVDWEGKPVGQAIFTEGAGGVLIRLEISERTLPPGWHGLHIHQTGRCADPSEGFQASGAHVRHGGGAQHGLLNMAAAEPGDLPNLFVPAAGAYGAEFFATGVTLVTAPSDGRMPLLDDNGSALIVHAGPDDHRAQPIGGAGARIACAALTLAP